MIKTLSYILTNLAWIFFVLGAYLAITQLIVIPGLPTVDFPSIIGSELFTALVIGLITVVGTIKLMALSEYLTLMISIDENLRHIKGLFQK